MVRFFLETRENPNEKMKPKRLFLCNRVSVASEWARVGVKKPPRWAVACFSFRVIACAALVAQ